LNENAADLDAAMNNRSVIDTACGVIISQNRCTPQEAFDILRKASNDRNHKLHDLARVLVAGVPAHQQAHET
jgi:AmiR/NasT family two-component response regulator